MKESIQELKRRIGIPNLRWWMLSFFILVMIFNYVDRASISIALPLIMKDLGFKAIVSGIVLSAFFWSYTFMQMPGGWLVDKLGPRKIVSTSIIGWGVAEAITGLASSTGALIFLRVLLGTLEGPVQVGMNTSMTKWLRREERGRGSTLIDGGGPLGIAVGGFLVTWLIICLGTWRFAFLALGIMTVFIGILAACFMRDDPRTHPLIGDEEIEHLEKQSSRPEESKTPSFGSASTTAKEAPSVSLVQYFTRLPSLMLLLAFAAYDVVQYGLLTWAPFFVGQVRHVSFGMTGFWTVIIFGSGFLGEVVAGQLADRWRKTESRVNLVMRTLLGIAGLLVAVAVIFVNYVESAVAAGILLSITNFFLRWGGLYWSVPPMLAEEGHVGRLSGAMNFAGNVAGIAIPLVVGWIFTVTNSFSGVFLLFGICGLVMAGASVVLDYSRTLSR
jgi:MFS transporter, ACS family, D-galactonate transporter